MKKSLKILAAPDSFKGCISSREICDIIGSAVKKVSPLSEVIKVPLADGGEGTVDALVYDTNGRFIEKQVTGPVNEKVKAVYGILGDNKTAVIEMASASGLPLVHQEKRDPKHTTTFGTGELIKDAIERGCRKIILGIGGSATNDCGVGALQALGFSFRDISGHEIPFGGIALGKIDKIDVSKRIKALDETLFLVACDVNNPLLGETGATFTYGPQKGADDTDLVILEDALKHFNKKIEAQLNKFVSSIPGAGAAGGLGAGLLAFLNAELQSGIELVKQTINFESYFQKHDFDLVLTGEGALDYQTAYGKLPVGVSGLAKKYDVPVVAIVGTIGKEAEKVHEKGIDAVLSIINAPMDLEQAIHKSRELIFETTVMITRFYLAAFSRGCKK